MNTYFTGAILLKHLKTYFCILLFMQVSSMAQAQVTIGSDIAPIEGVLLDLKENDSDKDNSQRGIALPRVKLTDVDRLYPMLPEGYDKNEKDKLYEGLVVYNTNPDFDMGKGIYVWQYEDLSYAWVSMRAKTSISKRIIAIVTKSSQTIPARVSDVNPVTTNITWTNVEGINIEKVQIQNGTDIYLPPTKTLSLRGI